MPGRKASEEQRKREILDAAFQVAQRQGLHHFAVRDVAARAGLSTGLVFFHFKTKDDLLLALLDWLLETTAVLRLSPEIEAIASPLERLLALLRQETERLTREPGRIRLFFEFWLLGLRNRAVRGRIRAELARYRAAFRPIAESVLAAEPERFSTVTPEGLASVAVAFIKGCAVQSVIDERFDIEAFRHAADALVAQLEAATA
ncbi:MAG: TetR/AcrR family transcriptional regulator [Gemmatimonadetes bacterium]|nr:TetR/AcrR family transcriptional regulator [Gemmatimonadota bacterium]